MVARNSRQKKVKSLVKRRPAETVTGTAGAIVALVSAVFNFHLSPDVVAALIVLIGAAPAIISGIVDHFTAAS